MVILCFEIDVCTIYLLMHEIQKNKLSILIYILLDINLVEMKCQFVLNIECALNFVSFMLCVHVNICVKDSFYVYLYPFFTCMKILLFSYMHVDDI